MITAIIGDPANGDNAVVIDDNNIIFTTVLSLIISYKKTTVIYEHTNTNDKEDTINIIIISMKN